MAMGFTKRQRCAVGIGLLAVGALATDRLFLLPGPSSASADTLASGEGLAAVVDMNALETLAERLVGLCMSEAPDSRVRTEVSGTPDPFLSPWVSMQTDAVASQTEHAGGTIEQNNQIGLPELTAIVSANGRGYGVIDGKPLSVGASRNGYTLIELSSQSAKIMKDGSIHTLPLRK